MSLFSVQSHLNKKIGGDSIDLFLVFQVERKTVMTTETLFGWIDVERPIKWMLMCEKMKPCSVGSMLKDQLNGRLCVKRMKPYTVGSMLKDQSNGCLCVKKIKPCSIDRC